MSSEVKAKNKFDNLAEWPTLPPQIPQYLERITAAYAACLQTRDTTIAQASAKVMMKYMTELNDAFTELYKAAHQVDTTAQPLINQRGPKGQKVAAVQAFDQLRKVMTTKMAAGTERPAVSITPNFLPHVSGLNEEIKGLQTNLKLTMDKALAPSHISEPEDLKKSLGFSKAAFQDLASKVEYLTTPVNELSLELDSQVELTRKHWGTILISRTVCDWELKRIEIFSTILTELTSLSKDVAGLTQEIEDAKKHIRENPFKPVDQAKMSLTRMLEIQPKMTLEEAKLTISALLKECSATNPPEAKKTLEEALARKEIDKLHAGSTLDDAKELLVAVLNSLPKTTFDEARRQFEIIRYKYNNCLKIAQDNKDKSEAQIKELDLLIEKKEEVLFKSIDTLPFHDPKIEKDVKSTLENSVATIQQERETLRYTLNEVWSHLKEQLQKDSYDCLYYEGNRLGYSIFENNGTIPYDSRYNVRIVGWTVQKKYLEPLV